MKKTRSNPWRFLSIALLASSSLQAAQGPFIEVKAEVQADAWDQYFFSDTSGVTPNAERKTIFYDPSSIRCVFGPDTWMMEMEGINYKETYWFTGTNIIEHLTEKTKGAIPADYPKTRTFPSIDGNPGRPERVTDVFGFFITPQFFWLAFCSAPTFRHAGHTIYPPNSSWKEYSKVRDWLKKADVFKDSLGLPKSIKLYVANEQPVLQYQVHQTTNLLGWNIPMEFYGVQYKPTGTNVWETDLTFKGRVVSIGPGKEPQIPADVINATKR
jgi:hypothetical protein